MKPKSNNGLFDDNNVKIIVCGIVAFIMIAIITTLAFMTVKNNKKEILEKGRVISKEKQAEIDRLAEENKKPEDEVFEDGRLNYPVIERIEEEDVPDAKKSELKNMLEASIDSGRYEMAETTLNNYRDQGFNIPEELIPNAKIVESMYLLNEIFNQIASGQNYDPYDVAVQVPYYLNYSPTPEEFVSNVFKVPKKIQKDFYIHSSSYVVPTLLMSTGEDDPTDYKFVGITTLANTSEAPYFSNLDIEVHKLIETIYRAEFTYREIPYYFDFYKTNSGEFYVGMVNLKNPEDESHRDVLLTAAKITKYFK